MILIETYEIAKNGVAMANKDFGHLLNLVRFLNFIPEDAVLSGRL